MKTGDCRISKMAIVLTVGLLFPSFNTAAATSSTNHLCASSLGHKNGDLRGESITSKVEARATGQAALQIVPSAQIQQRLKLNSGIVIGWSRNSSGKVIPLYSNDPNFKSVRNLPNTDPFGAGWNEERRVEIVSLEATKAGINDAKLQENIYFQSLPTDLQEVFKSGSILKTTTKTQNTQWALLMVTAPDGEKTGGRTGVLLRNGIPLVLVDRHSGKEFLLELKGAGAPDGTFSKDHHFTFRGGAVARQVEREHANMNYVENLAGDSVRSAGFVTFVTSLGHQGILFRLTPGTVRGTFTDSPAFKHTPDTKTKMVHDYGKIWGNFLGQGAIPMSHPENIVADAAMENFFPTDLSDVLPATRFPVSWGHKKIELSEAVSRSLTSYSEIGGIGETERFHQFKAGLVDGLALSGFNPSKDLQEKILASGNVTETGKVILHGVLYPKLLKELEKSGFRSSEVEVVDFHRTQILSPSQFIAKVKTAAAKYSMQNPSSDQAGYYDLLSKSDEAVVELLGELGHHKIDHLDAYVNVRRAPKGRLQVRVALRLTGDEIFSLKICLQDGLKELIAILSSTHERSPQIQESLDIANQRLLEVQNLAPLQIAEIANRNFDYFNSLLELPYFKK